MIILTNNTFNPIILSHSFPESLFKEKLLLINYLYPKIEFIWERQVNACHFFPFIF